MPSHKKRYGKGKRDGSVVRIESKRLKGSSRFFYGFSDVERNKKINKIK